LRQNPDGAALAVLRSGEAPGVESPPAASFIGAGNTIRKKFHQRDLAKSPT
jgi:hypothetical protein